MNLYFLNTGDTNWNNPLNWSDTDGGTTVNVIPTQTDNVFLTALSGDIISSDAVTTPPMASLNCTGYTKTLLLPAAGTGLYIYGNLILSPQMKLVCEVTYTGTGRSILMAADCQITTNGIIIPYLRVGIAPVSTITLMDTLNVSGLLTINGNINTTWAGSFGFITSNLTLLLAGKITLSPSGSNYIVKSKFTYMLERGNAHGLVKSSTPGTKAKLTVTGDTNIGYVDFTDIDASGGRTLYPFNGVVTNCININVLTDRVAPANTTVSSSRIS